MSEKISIDEYALGERIRYFRKRRCFTQAQLAKKCGVCQATVAHIEKSYTLPSIQLLRLISNHLDVQIAILFSGEEVPVLDIKKLKAKYKKASDLSPTLLKHIRQVVTYAKSLGID